MATILPIRESFSDHPKVDPETRTVILDGPSLRRNYRSERARADIVLIDNLVTIREHAEQGELDHDKWMCLVKVLLACPLPYRPTALRQVTRRTRFQNQWVTITYTACRPSIELPFGADNKLMHWLFDLGIRQAQDALNGGGSDVIRYRSTRNFLTDCGMTDAKANYETVKNGFRRLTGLAITVEFENNCEERGAIIPLLDQWCLPRSIAQAAGVRKGRTLDEYGFVLSNQLREHSEAYSVRVPRQLWRLLKGKPLQSALLLWMFHRAWSAEGESKIKWEILRNQFWYDDSNPRRLPQCVRRVVSLLLAMWPTATVHVENDGLVFDKATGYLLSDNYSKKRVRRLRRVQLS